MADAERARLLEVPKGRSPVAALRPVPRRARLGHRPRGLQRDRRGLGLLPARPRPLARLPLERGRPGRHLRRPPAALLRARVLERPRPDPEGAPLRPHRPAGKPRRGRQGVLVVPRLDADALVDALALHVPAGRVPLRRARGGERAAAAATSRSTSCSTPASSTTAATGRSRPTTPRPRPTTSSSASRCGTPGPTAATIDVLPTLWFRNTWSWGLDPRRPSLRLEGPAIFAEHWDLGGRWLSASGTPTPLFCENETNAERLWGLDGSTRLPEGRDRRPRRPRHGDRQSRS